MFMEETKEVSETVERIKKGGAEKYHKKLKEQNKLFVRDRLELLLDPEFRLEDGLLANCMDDTRKAFNGTLNIPSGLCRCTNYRPSRYVPG